MIDLLTNYNQFLINDDVSLIKKSYRLIKLLISYNNYEKLNNKKKQRVFLYLYTEKK